MSVASTVVALSGLNVHVQRVVNKSPAVTSGALHYIKKVFSGPTDLCLGGVWFFCVVSSFSELVAEKSPHPENAYMRLYQKKVVKEERVVLRFLIIANTFKLIDWFGKSALVGIKKYPFPKFSLLADVVYACISGNECLKNISNMRRIKKESSSFLTSYKSKKYYQALEMREIADFVSNFFYLGFSAMSIAMFFTSTTFLGPAMLAALGVYFVFLAVKEIANVASQESCFKNKQVHWLRKV